MSNLPPGVSDNTFGAPYNDIDWVGYIDVRIIVSGSVNGPNPDWREVALEVLQNAAHNLEIKTAYAEVVDYDLNNFKLE